MSTPTNDQESTQDAPLVEPVSASWPTERLEELDTARILEETSAIPVVSQETESGAEESVEANAGPTVQDVVPQGWNILSIVSVVLALAVSPLAVVFGYVAVGQIRRSAQRGEGLAWFAVALGWVWAVAYVVAGTVLALTWIQVA